VAKQRVAPPARPSGGSGLLFHQFLTTTRGPWRNGGLGLQS